jgi:TusE/DsrC/DsvC family sulfur relay protein
MNATLEAQVAWLVERERKKEELLAEMTPILREVISTATTKLADYEKRGWFDSARELGRVIERVLDHYKPGEAKPLGLMGVARAARDRDVQRGLGMLMEFVRQVGRASGELEAPPADRKQRLASMLGPKRKKLLALPAPATCATPRPTDGEAIDPAAWTRELAEKTAAADGITLTADHWKIIDAARADFLERKVAANIRRLTQISGVGTRELYALFPKAPGRTIARIAGTPKPAGCI